MRRKIKKGCFCVVAVMASCFLSSCGKTNKTVSIYTEAGDLVGEVTKEYDVSEEKMVYFDVAISEATSIVAQLEECGVEDARKKLWKKGYQIYTYLDTEVYNELAESCKEYKDAFNCGAAMTDLEGNLVAVYSHSAKKENANYALYATSPYSSLKPLGVYMQAVEKGLIHWSTTYEDSAYKQVKDSDGKERPWPANASGEYSEKDVTIHEALKKSLNTVAVKCLKDVGVNNSLDFLQTNFAIPLSSEQYAATVQGEEEVIGNLALGYLTEGVTPVDMAGYYQIFANGGSYEVPRAVQKICDKDGNVIYERQYTKKDVIQPVTADMMNKLLREVTKTGGTAHDAFCGDIEVAGKTGSSEGNQECWFVGVSPEYSCAIWHGANSKNMAPNLFSTTMKGIYGKNADLSKTFTMHSSFEKYFYCEESGKMISPNCTSVQMGYYVLNTELGVCDKH